MSLTLPGLRGSDPLGFLAAMGLVSLSEQGEIPALRLAWTDSATPVATVSGDCGSVETLANALEEAVARMSDQRAALPGVPPHLPRAKAGSGKDPMRMSREQLQQIYREADQLWMDGDRWTARWIVGLTGQTTVDKEGAVRLTPFYAPTGQMSLRGSIFDHPRNETARIHGPGDALTAWRRVPFDGANFDERAIRDRAATTWGGPANQGVPSATWLAAMGIRLFPMVDDGRTVETTGWQALSLYHGYTRRSLIWPIWSPALGPAAVRTLLSHRAIRLRRADDGELRASSGELSALGVLRLYGSSRATRQQGDGPLGPARPIWSAP